MKTLVIRGIEFLASVLTILQICCSVVNNSMYKDVVNQFFYVLPILFIACKWFCHLCINAVIWMITVVNAVDGKVKMNKKFYFFIKLVIFTVWFAIWYMYYGVLLSSILTAVMDDRVRFVEVSVWFVCMLVLSCRQELLYIFRNKDLKQQFGEAVGFHVALYVLYFVSTTLHIFM